MKKWFLLLACALLFNAVCARAEGDIYCTNNKDAYYHLDENCDRPAETNWWDGAPTDYYEREVYRKYKISETAAAEFQKKPCPICVKKTEAVYLGEYMPNWPYAAPAWEINGLTDEQEDEFRDARPRAFLDEIVKTSEAFNDYFEEIYNKETGQHEQKHAYPAAYAGKYSNNASCTSYEIVDPDEEILSAFKRMFGGGAWIVPAKYGYDEIMSERDRVVEELYAWCDAHPEVDARWSSADSPDYENCVVIGIDGADWEKAAAAMEETAPIYIHFTYEEQATTDWSVK